MIRKAWLAVLPDGRVICMINPDGITQEQALAQVAWRWKGVVIKEPEG